MEVPLDFHFFVGRSRPVHRIKDRLVLDAFNHGRITQRRIFDQFGTRMIFRIHDVLNFDLVLGQGSGLVRAKRVHISHVLYCFESLDYDLLPSQSDRTIGQPDSDYCGQGLRDMPTVTANENMSDSRIPWPKIEFTRNMKVVSTKVIFTTKSPRLAMFF